MLLTFVEWTLENYTLILMVLASYLPPLLLLRDPTIFICQDLKPCSNLLIAVSWTPYNFQLSKSKTFFRSNNHDLSFNWFKWPSKLVFQCSLLFFIFVVMGVHFLQRRVRFEYSAICLMDNDWRKIKYYAFYRTMTQ